jgi:hypothetical protein
VRQLLLGASNNQMTSNARVDEAHCLCARQGVSLRVSMCLSVCRLLSVDPSTSKAALGAITAIVTLLTRAEAGHGNIRTPMYWEVGSANS